MCLEVLKSQEKFTFDNFSGLNDINKRMEDPSKGYKTLSKVFI